MASTSAITQPNETAAQRRRRVAKEREDEFKDRIGAEHATMNEEMEAQFGDDRAHVDQLHHPTNKFDDEDSADGSYLNNDASTEDDPEDAREGPDPGMLALVEQWSKRTHHLKSSATKVFPGKNTFFTTF